MKYLAFIWRVLRRMVWKRQPIRRPAWLHRWHICFCSRWLPDRFFSGTCWVFSGTDPTKLHRMFLFLKSFMPPDPKVQDILDSAMANVVVTGSSGLLANAGIVLESISGPSSCDDSRALSHTYGMREDPHWWSKYIISFFMLFWFGIIIVFCFNAIVFR